MGNDKRKKRNSKVGRRILLIGREANNAIKSGDKKHK